LDANIAVTQFTAAGIAAYGIQVLKKSKWWPLLSEQSSTWIKRLYSIVTAIGVHTGIGAVWNQGAPPVGYKYQLILNIPAFSVIVVTVWHWISQFVMQEGWYQVAFNKVIGTNPNQALVGAPNAQQVVPVPKP
jgi:hypothetical protein